MTEQKALEVLKSWLQVAYQNADGTDEASAELYEALQTVFALIKRQEEEIEQLKFETAKLLPKDCPCAIQIEVSSKLEAQIKSEAIKEFAEKLKEKAMQKFDWNEYVEVEEIDNIVKEMVGDKE